MFKMFTALDPVFSVNSVLQVPKKTQLAASGQKMIFCVFHIWELIRRSSTKKAILTKMKHQPSSCCYDWHSKCNSGCTLGTQATSWSTVLWHPLDIFLAFSFGCPVATSWMMILTRWGSLIWKNIVYINMI